MTLLLGDIAPDFEAATTHGPLSFHQWMDNSWTILFSHPMDFTPVCTTELGRMSELAPEFESRGVKLLSLSVNDLTDHRRWIADIEETQGVTLEFPMVADSDGRVAELYGMIDPGSDDVMTVRSVFVIGPDRKIKLILTYPASTGRNFAELLRVVDSLQLTSEHKVATPVDWSSGDDVFILPTLTEEEARRRFPNGWRTVRPYMKVVPDPAVRKAS